MKIFLIGIVSVLVIGGVLAWVWFALADGGLVWESLVLLIIAVFALGALFFCLKNKFSEVGRGIPLRDERSNRVMMVAAAKTFVLSIWVLLIMSFLSESVIEFRDAGQALNFGILVMAVIFGLAWLWYRNKKNVEEVKF